MQSKHESIPTVGPGRSHDRSEAAEPGEEDLEEGHRCNACPCGKRHSKKRPCMKALLTHVSFEERVPKGQFGVCPWCSVTIKNDNRYTSHLATEHGYRAPARRFLTTNSVCQGCLMCYHTPARLLYHLTGRDCRGSRCLVGLVVGGFGGNEEEVLREIEGEERIRINSCRSKGRGAKATEGKTPYRYSGPLESLQAGPMPMTQYRIPLQTI